ncbi:serine protease inhibitor swm-1-like [Anomaloglossus baeobatrachus]
MGFLTLSVVFLVAVLQWQTDCYVVRKKVTVCPPNSHYGTITGCDTTCNSPYYPGKICTYHFYSGCQCNAGYIAATGNSAYCIKPEDCKGKCGPNRHYEPYASTCQPNCDAGDVPDECQIVPSCVCDDGYILSGFECVKKDECPISS